MKKTLLVIKDIILFSLGLFLITGVVNSILLGVVVSIIFSSILSLVCFYFSRNLFKNKTLKIIIYLIVLTVYIPFIVNFVEKNTVSNIKLDALKFIQMAETQYILNDGAVYCYSINGFDPDEYHYENAGNYIGSVSVDDDFIGTIQLSDGKYMAKGTLGNISIFRSKLTASDSCK